MANKSTDFNLSVEQLEGDAWPDPPEGSTGLVKNVHELRRTPIKDLDPWYLARLIGQNVGLRWLLPRALQILKETAPRQASGGFYDDDLLTAVLTRKEETWNAYPECARQVNEILRILTDLPSYVRIEVEKFRTESSKVPDDIDGEVG